MKILITTSREPSQRTRSFVKDLVSVIPGSERLTRGKAPLEDLIYEAEDREAERVVVVEERQGNPSRIIVYDLNGKPIYTFILRGVSLARERDSRVYGAENVCVRLYHLMPGADKIAKAFADAFGLKVVESPEETADCDIILDVEEERGYWKVFFRVPSSKKVVGPIIRVREVVRGGSEDKGEGGEGPL